MTFYVSFPRTQRRATALAVEPRFVFG